MARAFDSLSEKCRNVVWLRRVEGLSQRETARRLGVREGAVESQLARGVRVLAQAVFGLAEGADPRHTGEGIPTWNPLSMTSDEDRGNCG